MHRQSIQRIPGNSRLTNYILRISRSDEFLNQGFLVRRMPESQFLCLTNLKFTDFIQRRRGKPPPNSFPRRHRHTTTRVIKMFQSTPRPRKPPVASHTQYHPPPPWKRASWESIMRRPPSRNHLHVQEHPYSGCRKSTLTKDSTYTFPNKIQTTTKAQAYHPSWWKTPPTPSPTKYKQQYKTKATTNVQATHPSS